MTSSFFLLNFIAPTLPPLLPLLRLFLPLPTALFVLVDGDVTPEVQRRGQRSGRKRKAEITGLNTTRLLLGGSGFMPTGRDDGIGSNRPPFRE